MHMRRFVEERARLALLLGAGGLTALASGLVGAGVWRVGVPGEWQWPFYRFPARWSLVGPALASAAALGGLGAYGALRRTASRLFTGGLVAAMVVAALGLFASLDALGPRGMVEEEAYVTVAPWVGGYYLESLRVRSLREFLARYDDNIRPIPINDPLRGHISDHPPGPIVLHVLVNRFVGRVPAVSGLFYPGERTHRAIERDLARRPLARHEVAGIGAAAMLFRGFAALVVVPVYLLGRAAYSRRAGLLAAALSALIPALHVFGPYVDQVQPFLCALILWLFWRAARSPHRGWAWSAAAGVSLFAALQFTLAFLALGFTMAVAAALMALAGGASRRADEAASAAPEHGGRETVRDRLGRWGLLALGGVMGVLVPALASFLVLDYDVMNVWWLCFSKHAAFAETFHRTYWKWVLFGPVEVALFVGPPVACLVVWRAAHRAWGRLRRRTLRAPADALLWALLATAFALNVSGKNLGEVARLWMFLMPLGAVAAAGELDRWRRPVVGFVVTAGLMAYQGVVFVAVLDVFGA